jgi:hypothetical protein
MAAEPDGANAAGLDHVRATAYPPSVASAGLPFAPSLNAISCDF